MRGGSGPTSSRCLRRAVVTSAAGSPDDPTTAATTAFLKGQGVSVISVDASSEDPFVDVDHLMPEADLSGADAVIALGSPSATALAIALLCDLPLTVAGAVDGERLRAIDVALDGGAAMHRSVLDIEVDGVRRLCLRDLEIVAPTPVSLAISQAAGERRVEGARIKIASERPHSGQLSVRPAGGPTWSASRCHVDAAPPGTRVAINGREQELHQLSVIVHDVPLRELVLGAQSRRSEGIGTTQAASP